MRCLSFDICVAILPTGKFSARELGWAEGRKVSYSLANWDDSHFEADMSQVSEIPPEGDDSEDLKRSYNVATTRIFDVLAAFVFQKPEFGVTELSNSLGMTKNMIYRALATLVEHRILMRDETGRRYQLSYRVLELQNPNFPLPDIRTIAEPFLERLHAATGMTVQLSIRAGDGQVVIDGVEGRGVLVTRTKLGQYFPLHASSASRAILAGLDDEEIEAYLERRKPLERFTENTLTTPEEIWEEIRTIRGRGYALSIEDYNRGSTGISFNIPSADGSPHGAVTIGASARLAGKDMPEEVIANAVGIVEELRSVAALYDRM